MTYYRRPLIPCLVLFVAGVISSSYLGTPTLAALGALSVMIAAALTSYKFRDATPVFLGCFFLLGLGRMTLLEQERRAAKELFISIGLPRPVVAFGKVIASDIESDTGRFRFVLDSVTLAVEDHLHALPGRLLVSVRETGLDELPPPPVVGEWLSIRGQVEEPIAFQNFFGVNFQEQLARQRIYSVLRVSGSSSLQRHRAALSWSKPLHSFLRGVRLSITATLRGLMPEREGRLVVSLIFNDRRMLEDDDVRVLRDSGTFHLFAVSGMHVGITAMILLILGRVGGLRWRTAWTFAALVIWMYVAAIGFPAPAWRAALMVTAVALSRWLRREVDSISTFAFACAVAIFFDPLSLWQPGFLLSVAGVFAILAFYPLLRLFSPLRPAGTNQSLGWQVVRFFGEILCLTLSTTLVLLPLQLFYFQRFNLFSPLANVFASALSPPIMGGALAAVCGDLLATPLGEWAGAATALCMKLLYGLAATTANIEWALLRIPQPPLAIVFIYYLILVSGYYFVQRDSPEYAPKARARLTIHATAACLVLVMATAWQRAERLLRIWFFDVGQGDSALILFPDGQSLLVDTGNATPNIGRLVVEPQLSGLGLYPLDNLLLTHEDSDHSGGAAYLLQKWRVRRVVIPSNFTDAEATLSLEGAGRDHLPLTTVLAAGFRKELARDVTIEVLNPPADTHAAPTDNNRSLVLLVRYGNFRALFTGDAEEQAEQFMLRNGLTHCDVLKVGHHGSVSSSTPAFINALRPKLAIISCGRRNPYGHPNPAVLQRLREVGAAIYRTDIHGAVLITSDGKSFRARTAARAP